MTPLARRLARLEAHQRREEARLPWAEVHAARARQQARLRLKLGRLLQMDDRHPWVMEAMARLVGDDPARVAQDAELVAGWSRQQGREGSAEAPGAARQRLAQRLDSMGRRQDAGGSS